MFCPNCGQPLHKGAAVCATCGAKNPCVQKKEDPSVEPVRDGAKWRQSPTVLGWMILALSIIAYIFYCLRFQRGNVEEIIGIEFNAFKPILIRTYGDSTPFLVVLTTIFKVFGHVFFWLFIVCHFINFNALLPMVTFNVKRIVHFGFLGCAALALFFSLCAAVFCSVVQIRVGWPLALIILSAYTVSCYVVDIRNRLELAVYLWLRRP